MSLVGGFWIAFVLTVVLLIVSLVSGFAGRRRLHLWTGPATIVGLAVAVVLTEQLVKRYTFPAEMTALHLPIAFGAGLLAVPVVATGVWTWRDPTARTWHRLAVFVFVGATLAAAATGLWMFAHATPR
ncbi:MAG: hypothetical protein IPK26_14845 [Planctomycetes bacterium]|nr:hypothetical protein [Planctomycetota bacterium]